jgi:hypothetical protein
VRHLGVSFIAVDGKVPRVRGALELDPKVPIFVLADTNDFEVTLGALRFN